MKKPNQSFFVKAGILLLLVNLNLSCNSKDNPIDDLSANRQLWESTDIKNYTISEKYSCFCGGVLAWKTLVENGIKISVEFDDPSSVDTYDAVFQRARTIDDVFDLLVDLYSQRVESIQVEYDKTYGFPSVISVDFDGNAIDDEIVYSYTDFVITN